jgi:hypothetical protein
VAIRWTAAGETPLPSSERASVSPRWIAPSVMTSTDGPGSGSTAGLISAAAATSPVDTGASLEKEGVSGVGGEAAGRLRAVKKPAPLPSVNRETNVRMLQAFPRRNSHFVRRARQPASVITSSAPGTLYE